METPRIQYDLHNDLGVVTLRGAAPGKPPTLDHAVLHQLDAALDAAERHASEGCLRLVILLSETPRYFAVGADVAALEQLTTASAPSWIRHGHAVFDRLAALPIPTLARVEGYALGGGLELALACDLIAATSSAQFALPEAKLGFVPGWGGSARLPARIGYGRARELIFTGRLVAADEAHAIGLVQFLAAGGRELDASIDAFLGQLRECAPGAVAASKRLLSVPTASAAAAELASTVERLQDPETLRRVKAFLDSRKK